MNKSNSLIEISHSNVWGLAPIASLFSYNYIVTFMDDFSCYTWVYLLKPKGDVFSNFTSFHKMVETQFDTKIKILHSDNGGEYSLLILIHILISVVLYTKPLVPAPPNRMGWSSIRIRTSWRLREFMFEMYASKTF